MVRSATIDQVGMCMPQITQGEKYELCRCSVGPRKGYRSGY